jgi:hypothetical protein
VGIENWRDLDPSLFDVAHDAALPPCGGGDASARSCLLVFDAPLNRPLLVAKWIPGDQLDTEPGRRAPLWFEVPITLMPPYLPERIYVRLTDRVSGREWCSNSVSTSTLPQITQ